MFQPGTEWQYSMGLDVLGRVIEVAAGVPFEDFVQTHVLDPLGMTDTVWHVDADRADRLAALYAPAPGTRKAFRYDQMGSRATTPPVAPIGGGGLCSTAGDYVRFAEMLRGRGELDGVRVLAPSTVAMMASNHLPGGVDLSAIGRPLFAETTFDGVGFGLGVSVTIDPVKAKVPGNVGDHGWGGAASTNYWVDRVDPVDVLAAPPQPRSPTLPGTLALTGSIVTLTPRPNPTPSNVVSANSGRPIAVRSTPPGRWLLAIIATVDGRQDAHAVELAAAAQHLGEAHVVAGRRAQAAAAERGDRRRRRPRAHLVVAERLARARAPARTARRGGRRGRRRRATRCRTCRAGRARGSAGSPRTARRRRPR